MTANPVFVQELADACQRPVEISAELEATSLGAGFLAGLAVGTWSKLDEVASVAQPRLVVEPAGPDRRARWKQALAHSRGWIPDFSALDF
jgi:glycerol kinase